MLRKTAILAFVISSLFTACQVKLKTDKGSDKNLVPVDSVNNVAMTDISYSVMKNYFVNNTVTKLDNPKIETNEKFNEIFGMAALMGKDGTPTTIDFTKQYVLAVLHAETDSSTTIEPIALQKNPKNEIVLSYKTVVGQNQSYKTRPFFGIIVDKVENGNVLLKDIK